MDMYSRMISKTSQGLKLDDLKLMRAYLRPIRMTKTEMETKCQVEYITV